MGVRSGRSLLVCASAVTLLSAGCSGGTTQAAPTPSAAGLRLLRP